MKRITVTAVVIFLLGAAFLLSDCGHNFDPDLKIKSDSGFTSPLGHKDEVNNDIYVVRGAMTNGEVIKKLMSMLFDSYTGLTDPERSIEDYVIKNTDIVLETKKGSVFGILYSVKVKSTASRWGYYEEPDRWTNTKRIYCSFYEQDDRYVLNIIGENPLYYKKSGDKLSTTDIAEMLFEKEYLFPRLFDDDKSSKLLSYNIDNIDSRSNKNGDMLFHISYSIQGVKGKCSWIFADESGKGSGTMNRMLKQTDNFYELKGMD